MTTPPDNLSSASSVASCAHCGLPVAPSLAHRHDHSSAADEPVFCCGGCRLVHSLLASRRADHTISSAMLRVGLGIFFSMNLMVFSFCFYGADTLVPQGDSTAADIALANLFRWLLFGLATGVMLTLWTQIARSAWDDLLDGRLQAGMLIAIGALAAYVVSAISVLRGKGPLYFDSASMILLLVTIGQYLEAKMKTAAVRSAEGRLLNLPDQATIESANGDQTISVSQVQPGQTVRVAAGSAIPVDGEILRGQATIDVSLLTGESAPQQCGPGGSVWAGSHLLEGVIWIRAAVASSERRIVSIVQQLHALRDEPTHIQRLTDRVASIFIPAIITLALAVFAFQAIANAAPMEGLMRALAVALIACPCALGLTAPLVVSRVASSLAQRGIIVRSGRALELAASVRHIVFDKTGTLTTGDFRVQHMVRVDPEIEPAPFAAALERASNHPIARAWTNIESTSLPIVEDLEPVNGLGVRGSINGEHWFIGRDDAGSAVRTTGWQPPAELNSLLPVILRRNDETVAWFGLAESIRPESAAVLRNLEAMNMHIEVLTGDVSQRGTHLGDLLKVNVHSAQTPESKRSMIRQRREESNAPVAFVGDGINDALALAEADLGITVAGGSDLAHASGQVSLLDGDLHRLVHLLHAARSARRRIALALSWSFGYNALGLTLAALGALTPAFAAIAMVLSSAVTIMIASRPLTTATLECDGPTRSPLAPSIHNQAPSPLPAAKVHPA